MSDTYTIVFLGDIVGRPGRTAVLDALPRIQQIHNPLFIIVNGENAAAGVGITAEIAAELVRSGVDGITLGNHAFNKKEIFGYLDSGAPIVRPANFPPGVPGKGFITITKEGVPLAIINLCGRTFMDGYDDPFRHIDRILGDMATPHRLIDFHAEATSEKIAFGYHCEGRATAVLGTHTHVTTADAQILDGGTAYITDVGMCGPKGSVIGMDREIILRRFRTALPTKFEVMDSPGVISGVKITVNRDSGRAVSIQRLESSELVQEQK